MSFTNIDFSSYSSSFWALVTKHKSHLYIFFNWIIIILLHRCTLPSDVTPVNDMNDIPRVGMLIAVRLHRLVTPHRCLQCSVSKPARWLDRTESLKTLGIFLICFVFKAVEAPLWNSLNPAAELSRGQNLKVLIWPEWTSVPNLRHYFHPIVPRSLWLNVIYVFKNKSIN